ncbi:hypothetical protein CBS101457_002584 [Exobasidium rhododendri]|nr:hypothetical protein CBS101457_002584 [Exobasidium rhododendri]
MYEVDYSSGVINLRLADHGTYVINKQPANKQIWFSSPTSGPKRFDYDSEQKAWFMLKDGEESNMRDLLDKELSQIFGREVKVNLGES